MRNEKRVVIKEETSNLDGKIDSLAKSVERIMDRPPIRNPKFRKNPNTRKNSIPNQRIRPPFQENYAEGL